MAKAPHVAAGWTEIAPAAQNIGKPGGTQQTEPEAKADLSATWGVLTDTLSHNLPASLARARSLSAQMHQAVS